MEYKFKCEDCGTEAKTYEKDGMIFIDGDMTFHTLCGALMGIQCKCGKILDYEDSPMEV